MTFHHLDQFRKTFSVNYNTQYVVILQPKYDKVPNFTYIKEYETKHRDLIKLKYGSIEKLADLVIKSINDGRDYIVDKGQIREMFTEVVQVGKLCSEDIPKGKHKKLKRLLVEIEKEIEDSGK